jgi:hypothetical protein
LNLPLGRVVSHIERCGIKEGYALLDCGADERKST